VVHPVDIETYRRLNEELAEALFPWEMAGKPVYVLPEPDVLAGALKRAELPDDDPTGQLAKVVRTTLYLDPADEGTGPLRWHVLETRWHQRRRDRTPPSLALLAVLALAADAMHAGDGMSAANYYGRLMTLLDVPKARQSRLQQAYMGYAEELWISLNRWLEVLEGERGVPTAYSVAQRYIGLPMSQALVRQRDRDALPEIFWDEGLPPGFRMAAVDMEQVLEPWVNRIPSPLSQPLRKLWTNAAARDRIVQVACLELESWEGQDLPTQDPSRPKRAGAARLLAFVRSFPRKALELNLSLPSAGAEDSHALTLETAHGPVDVPTSTAPMGTVRIASTREVDVRSLLEDKLVGKIGGALRVERLPRRLVPLRWDELQGCHVEVERVELGDDTVLLAAGELRQRIDGLLREVARPGYECVTDLPGLPDGWILYRDVQVLEAFEDRVHMDLMPLLPRARTSLTLNGGFALPGRLRKWSSLDPPEVVATAAGAHRITLNVERGHSGGGVVWSKDFDGGVALAPLAPLGLEDGEYIVSMTVDGGRKAVATSLVRLRSADTPALDMTGRPSGLVYAPNTGPMWPMTADTRGEPPYIDGARMERFPPPEDGADSGGTSIPEFQPRQRRKVATRPSVTRIGQELGERSCMRTGMHRIQLPTAGPGRPRSKTMEGECTTCGLVKRYPTTARGAQKGAPAERRHAPVVLDVPPVDKHDDTLQRVALDALSHVGHGTASTFMRIAGQVESSGPFADTFLREQELLGHIDVRRDDQLSLVEWEMTPATLVPVSRGDWVLVGARNRKMIQALESLVEAVGGVVEGGLDERLLRVRVSFDPRQADQVAGKLRETGVHLQEHSPAFALAASLPPLSTVEKALRRIPVPSFKSLEIWDTTAAAWIPATSIAAVAAYRLRTFASTYVIRSRADLEGGTVALATAHLAKHLANAWAGDPLIRYHGRSGSVLVPLGADVPGLYGRALALCSGRVPTVRRDTKILQYHSVPKSLASVVHDRLMT
jgi:hypothetical protein